MPRPTPTEIVIDEHNEESHESWLLIRANNVSGAEKLFDSEIVHQHYIQVTISRCTRKREFHQDWLHATEVLMELDMSLAQWGAFVSSFGHGSGVPATLNFFQNKAVPRVITNDSRLAKSHQEVNDATRRGMEGVKKAEEALQEAFERGAGKRELRELLRTLHIKIDQMPGNMEFAAKRLSEHVENVVTKARSDVEAMAYQAVENGTALAPADLPMLTSGE